MVKQQASTPRPWTATMKRIRSVLVMVAAIGVFCGASTVRGGTPPQSHAGAVAREQARAQQDTADFIARIEARQRPATGELGGLTIHELMRRFEVPGVSVAVVRDFKIHWAKGYGVADRTTGRPVDPGTMFQAASISKPIAAMASLRLVQEGRFALDDDINTILKSWRVPESELTREQPVTPRSLMSHTSGADDGFGFPGYPPGTPVPTLVQIVRGESPSNVGAVRFARPPFQAYKYSGGSYAIMQLALTDLTGQPFAELMRTLVLEPLGMSNSTYAQPLPESFHARAARAYGDRSSRPEVPWHVYPEQAAAGLWTTPSDLARVIIEVQRALRGQEGVVLTRSSAQAMTSPVGVGPFAVGFTVGKQGEGWYFDHSGSNYGFRGLMRGHLRNGYGVVVLTNGSNGSRVANEVAARVASAYDWDSTHKPLPR